ncbi:sarcosine oxidase subunit gamma [Arthrobacter oryzae]|uniref:Sarcosine oxidase subunit gamma n=1 Tax=Arthrobacter oryzae TaxID=409290 RepID=A0A3N0BRE5_9MICC|nr:sarcosine oxidase subunit gamma family protein [Arthrobacter oryzae]RNL51370.1 sarcosine oxidase subunit gamma [Arthrobacter oryzae]
MADTAALEDINGLREVRRSPASHLAGAMAGGSISGSVTLKECPFQTMVGIRVDPDSDAGSRIGSVTGGLPGHSGETVAGDSIRVLWLGPTEFLVTAPEGAHDSLGGDLIQSLVGAVGDSEGQVVDLSANRTTFELFGPRARAVLEKGCSLDLHPRTFLAERALATEVGGIPVMLLKTGEESFRLFPRASFADFLGRWLLDAMREFASPEVH